MYCHKHYSGSFVLFVRILHTVCTRYVRVQYKNQNIIYIYIYIRSLKKICFDKILEYASDFDLPGISGCLFNVVPYNILCGPMPISQHPNHFQAANRHLLARSNEVFSAEFGEELRYVARGGQLRQYILQPANITDLDRSTANHATETNIRSIDQPLQDMRMWPGGNIGQHSRGNRRT